MHRLIPTALALLALPMAAVAQDAAPKAAKPLTVGDPAPALSIEKWVKGDPVPAFQPGKIYVVEFWATWCGPCIAGMPHLSDLQKQYASKGLTIVSVTSKDHNNKLPDVEKMVAEKGDLMGYTVAWDTKTKTNRAWMKAARQRGIPASFLVDGEGKIAFIGHPMWLDKPIAGLLAGTWDPAKGAAEVAAGQARLREVWSTGRVDAAAGLAKLESFTRDFPAVAAQYGQQHFGLLLRAKRFDEASTLGGSLVSKAVARKDAEGLNAVAWGIVDPEAAIEKRDLELAMRAAQSASHLKEGKDAAILDTLARVYFWKGDLAKALEIQTKAVDLVEDARMREGLEKALEEYRAAVKDGGDKGGK